MFDFGIDWRAISLLDAIGQFIDTGGPVLWGILTLSLLLWFLILERYLFLRISWRSYRHRWIADWEARADHGSWYARRIRQAMLGEARQELIGSLPIIVMLIALCPLLGLLGTVTGMIQVFDVMATQGTGDVRAMSAGVAAATVPTMAGMVVAISGLYFATRLKQMQRRRADKLASALSFQ